MSEMKCQNPEVNPFICKDGSYPLQSTVSQVERSLSIFETMLDFCEDVDVHEVSFNYNEACGLRYVLAGLRGALREVVEQLDDYEPKAEEASN